MRAIFVGGFLAWVMSCICQTFTIQSIAGSFHHIQVPVGPSWPHACHVQNQSSIDSLLSHGNSMDLATYGERRGEVSFPFQLQLPPCSAWPGNSASARLWPLLPGAAAQRRRGGLGAARADGEAPCPRRRPRPRTRSCPVQPGAKLLFLVQKCI